MDDLITWLLEQVAIDADRDRRVVTLAEEMYGSWQRSNPYRFDEQADDVRNEYLFHAGEIIDAQMSGVLAECEAKRRQIELHKPSWSDGKPEYDVHDEQTTSGAWVEVQDSEPSPPYWCLVCQEFSPCPTLWAYVELYAKLGRPGYQEEWKL